MHYSLVLVGAHEGRKSADIILRAAETGNVLLVEPVPWLFQRLQDRYGAHSSITLSNQAISETGGPVTFYAPQETANSVHNYGDQLGSLKHDHAAQHDADFAAHIFEVVVPSDTFEGLLNQYQISAIDVLFTDTEGYDAKLISGFPFQRFKPNQILFEFKHSDGVGLIGPNFARLVDLLDSEGYALKIIDLENCLAQLRVPEVRA